MNIGFTGDGMTDAQELTATSLIVDCRAQSIDKANHGDCVGGDARFHKLIRYWLPATTIVGHPCTLKQYRAYCDVDECREPLPPLERNRNVVDESDVIIATPKTETEQFTGTWATIRYARKVIKAGANKALYIIMPSGELIR